MAVLMAVTKEHKCRPTEFQKKRKKKKTEKEKTLK